MPATGALDLPTDLLGVEIEERIVTFIRRAAEHVLIEEDTVADIDRG